MALLDQRWYMPWKSDEARCAGTYATTRQPRSNDCTKDQQAENPASAKVPRTMLEARMEAVIEELSKPMDQPNAAVRQAHLALLKRWYYRPEVKREGEVVFPDDEGQWPIRSLLRAAGRVAAKRLATPNPQ